MDVIFDIDGTTLDISHRLKYVKQTPKNWKAFRDPKEKVHDEPIMPIINIARAFLFNHPRDRIIFASGRSESERADIFGKLNKNYYIDIDCPYGNGQSSYNIKKLLTSGVLIIMVISRVLKPPMRR